MKTLLLLRHAKSSWREPSLRDFERPLNGRGREAAPLMGRFMARRKLRPDLIICSPAERARQTASLLTQAAGLDSPLRYDERIYEATADQLLEVVTQIDESCATAMLVGHNPGMEELIHALTGESATMPTAALAHLTLEIDDWEKARPRCGRLDRVTKPKEVMGGE